MHGRTGRDKFVMRSREAARIVSLLDRTAMRQNLPNRQTRAIAGASAWTLLVIGLCAVGGEARADCARDARHRLEIGFAIGTDAAETPDQSPREGPRPCTGAMCSGNPATPMTDAPATTIEVEAWGLLVESAPAEHAGSIARFDDAGSIRPIDDGSSIFHPPRRPA